MRHLLFPLLAVALLAGCTKSDPGIDTGHVTEGEIRIASAIEGTGKTTRAAVTDGDELSNVQFLRVDVANDGDIPSNYFDGVTAIGGSRSNTNGKPIVFADPKPTYNLNGDKSYFVAYHPQTAVSTGSAVWAIDGKTDILLTPVWDAGKYSAPKTGAGGTAGDPMTFKHQLAQLEVICKASTADGIPESAVQDTWGEITSIELLNTASQVSYAYATNTMIYEVPGMRPLLKGATYADVFVQTAVTVNDENAVTAAGMFAPDVTPGSTAKIQLCIKTTKFPAGVNFNVQLRHGSGDAAGFTRGLKHTVTLSFRANTKLIDVTGTTLTPWGSGYAGNGEMEFPLPTPPAVNDYYYADGTTSKDLDANKIADGIAVDGIVFWVDPDDSEHYKVAALKEENKAWSTGHFDVGTGAYAGLRAETTDVDEVARQSGKTNRKILGRWIADPSANSGGKTIADFPAFQYCDQMGEGWYLPAVNELQYLHCTYNGSGPTLWGKGTTGSADNSSARSAFDTQFTKLGGDPFTSDHLWSATEYSTDNAWIVNVYNGDTATREKRQSGGSRCIKDVKLSF